MRVYFTGSSGGNHNDPATGTSMEYYTTLTCQEITALSLAESETQVELILGNDIDVTIPTLT